MMGLPTETDEDLAGIADLAYKVLNLYRKVTHKNNGKVTVSVSSFVPKSHTAFQWFGQLPIEEIERKQQYIKGLITGCQQIFFGDALVDDVAQALGPRFGRKGQAALADLLDLLGDVDGKAVDPQ